jgi:hypothetical protein
MRSALCAIAVALAGAAQAQDNIVQEYLDLPALKQVELALAQDPRVLGAKSRIGFEQSNRSRLDAGPYEFNVRMGIAQRRTTYDGNFNEWDVGLERALRLPDKGRLDRDLGAQGVAVAALSAGDAMHESGRMLLRLWFDWVRESGLLALWRRQTELVKQQQAVVARRVRAGDAARMELNLADAAVAQTQSAVLQAQTRESAARQAIARMYPAIVVPADALLLDPQPVGGTPDYWQERVLAHNHELAAARAEVKRRETMASRAYADRLPDPSVGVRYSFELSGQEKVTGVYLLVPIPGRARAATAQGANIQIDAARQHEADVLRRVETEIRQSYTTATGTFDAWSQLRKAAEGLRKHVELTLRSYQLGESGLADVIAARRLSVDSELAAIQAQVEAAHARYRLLLDAHTLWPLDPDEGRDGHAAH